ncbi:MAG: xanthine dehydrogenase family protein subunit M [Alphaproteobacteria bacterium]|nr:xanthine dehydrogenase family protein subunit M [Alphaproteobacteria bacterium]
MAAYARPTSLREALAALAEGPAVPLAGGTDLYPARVGRPPPERVLDLSAVAELRGVTQDADSIRIGAAVTWTELIESGLPDWCRALADAAGEIGGPQIQNRGTLAGNVCNASPAADGVPCLLALDARIEIDGRRTLPIAEFVLGSRRTALAAGEIVSAILLPKPRQAARSAFLKLGARKYLVISIAMVAGAVELAEDGSVAAARIAVGACGPVAQRLPALERRLVGGRLDPDLVRAEDFAALAPIDDMRGSAVYRRDAAMTLVRRLIGKLRDPG